MHTESFIPGKDASLESTIATMQQKLAARRFHLDESSWHNPVQAIWSVHVRDRECPMLFANGKGATQLAARASALGEFFERLGTHYFWTHFNLGETRAKAPFVHYPQERWFAPTNDGRWPAELLNPELHAFYNPDSDIDCEVLVDLNSGNVARGICALPYKRLSDGAETWMPVNIIGNLYVSNGMSAGNTRNEARAQALSEILERHVKFRIIASDARPEQCSELNFLVLDEHQQERQFKPPSLRNVAERGPYMHAGQFATLEEVLNHYNTAPEAPSGHSEFEPLNLSQKQIEQIIAFLKTLDGPVNADPKWLAAPDTTN